MVHNNFGGGFGKRTIQDTAAAQALSVCCPLAEDTLFCDALLAAVTVVMDGQSTWLTGSLDFLSSCAELWWHMMACVHLLTSCADCAGVLLLLQCLIRTVWL